MKSIGFIGAGNMGSAIISGIMKSEAFNRLPIYVCDRVINENIKKRKIESEKYLSEALENL